MAQTPDRMLIGETAWQKAVAREAIIRPLAFLGTLSAAERALACRQMGLKPSRFCQLLGQFRRKPLTSSLLDETPGPEKGRRLYRHNKKRRSRTPSRKPIAAPSGRQSRPSTTMFDWFAADLPLRVSSRVD